MTLVCHTLRLNIQGHPARFWSARSIFCKCHWQKLPNLSSYFGSLLERCRPKTLWSRTVPQSLTFKYSRQWFMSNRFTDGFCVCFCVICTPSNTAALHLQCILHLHPGCWDLSTTSTGLPASLQSWPRCLLGIKLARSDKKKTLAFISNTELKR